MTNTVKAEQCTDCENFIGNPGRNARLIDAAIELSALAEVLCAQTQETIGSGSFHEARTLSLSYNCISVLAEKLARELIDSSE